MRRYLNIFLNSFAVFFALPSLLVIVSWNAIPGDRLYGVKTGLEDVVLGITIKTPLAQALTIKYTERRFYEASRLLDKKGSTLGYDLLVHEAKESRDLIIEKQDSSSARELVTKIREYRKGIEQKKAQIDTGQIDIPVANPEAPDAAGEEPTTPTTTASPSPVATSKPTGTPPPIPDVITPESTEGDVVDDLDEADSELEEIEDELNKKLPKGQSALEEKKNEDKKNQTKEKGQSTPRLQDPNILIRLEDEKNIIQPAPSSQPTPSAEIPSPTP